MKRIIILATLAIAISSLAFGQVNDQGSASEKQTKINLIKGVLARLDDDTSEFLRAKNAVLNSAPPSKSEYAASEIDQGLANAVATLTNERALTRLALDYTAKRLSRLLVLPELSSYVEQIRASNRALSEGAELVLQNEQQQLDMIKEMQQAYHNRDAQRWNSLNQQYAAVQAKSGDLSAPVKRTIAEQETIMANVKSLLRDELEALQREGFTGTKVVHLTAKSWINPSSISLLISVKGVALRLGSNSEPTGPSLDPKVDDFKLYQTFVAEAKFVNGKVVSARFLPDSLNIRAGKTFGVAEGLIYVKQSAISDWKDKESVTFTRTVEGRPQLLFAEALGATMKEGFRPIFSTISVEIKGDTVIPHGYGSDFPSHKFWIGDKPLAEKKQVQPSEYFK